jgi:hypothetical protein
MGFETFGFRGEGPHDSHDDVVEVTGDGDRKGTRRAISGENMVATYVWLRAIDAVNGRRR